MNEDDTMLLGLVDDSPITSSAIRDDIRELVGAGEYGIAFDTLCSSLYEDEHQITRAYFERLQAAAKSLYLPRTTDGLCELIADTSIEAMATRGDYALLRWFGRKFPGLLVQGDTLSVLNETLAELKDLLNTGDIEEATFVLGELTRTMHGLQTSYEDMMKSAKIALPYAKRD
ncbi:MafI family immunity protein [Nocardia sp. NPDC051833]|uniref:DUF6959 family protein n=1 Tax=Nocardia sp. NPDC051833 TaxID=3155674 RepID=UPI0034257F51